MSMHVCISNPNAPDMGIVKIEFPIPKADYESYLEQLMEIGVGAPLLHDCRLTELEGSPRVLQELELNAVNLDEFDYLIKRLDSFTDEELAQFQATAFHLKLKEIKDLINLTFCCHQATVISDFSDLERAGKRHYLNQMRGSASASDYAKVDGEKTARHLISEGVPIVTPYGVLYENGMKLEAVYDGVIFPLYQYGAEPLVLEVDGPRGLTYLYLPMPSSQINRLLLRGDVLDVPPCCRIIENNLPSPISSIIDKGWDSIHDLNRLCEALELLDKNELTKLGAVISIATPDRAEEIVELIRNLELFEFVPDIRDAEEYGRYMIQESGRFNYDENLEEFYDYTGYGQHRIGQEHGIFTYQGYICYEGALSLEELMAGDPVNQDIQMNCL